jgi:hypothetical protein
MEKDRGMSKELDVTWQPHTVYVAYVGRSYSTADTLLAK